MLHIIFIITILHIPAKETSKYTLQIGSFKETSKYTLQIGSFIMFII